MCPTHWWSALCKFLNLEPPRIEPENSPLKQLIEMLTSTTALFGRFPSVMGSSPSLIVGHRKPQKLAEMKF